MCVTVSPGSILLRHRPDSDSESDSEESLSLWRRLEPCEALRYRQRSKHFTTKQMTILNTAQHAHSQVGALSRLRALRTWSRLGPDSIENSMDESEETYLACTKEELVQQLKKIRTENALERQARLEAKREAEAQTRAAEARLALERQARLEAEAQLDCSRWVTLMDLGRVENPVKAAKCYEEVASRTRPIFAEFSPPSGAAQLEKHYRPKIMIKTGVLDTAMFEKAHLWPYDQVCSKDWQPVITPWLQSKSVHGLTFDQLVDMAVRGYSKVRGGNRIAHAGLAHGRFNFLGHPNQFYLLDLHQLSGCVPVQVGGNPVSIESILEWDGQETSALVLPADSSVAGSCRFRKPGANQTFFEIDAHDPLVENAIKVFSDIFLMMMPYLSQFKVADSPQKRAKAELCKLLREFVKGNPGIRVPCPDLSKVEKDKKILVQNFPSRIVERPGQGRPPGSAVDNTNSSPHPFFLALRSINVWLTSNHLCGEWPSWDQHFRERCPDAAETTGKDKEALVLLPSCCDVSDNPDCIYCKSHLLISEPECYEDLDETLLDCAKKFIYLGVEYDDASFERVLQLRKISSEMVEDLAIISSSEFVRNREHIYSDVHSRKVR